MCSDTYIHLKNYCIPIFYHKATRNTKQTHALTELQFNTFFLIAKIDEIPVYGKKISVFYEALGLRPIQTYDVNLV